jgi:hypothetical protein
MEVEVGSCKFTSDGIHIDSPPGRLKRVNIVSAGGIMLFPFSKLI